MSRDQGVQGNVRIRYRVMKQKKTEKRKRKKTNKEIKTKMTGKIQKKSKYREIEIQ